MNESIEIHTIHMHGCDVSAMPVAAAAYKGHESIINRACMLAWCIYLHIDLSCYFHTRTYM